jgi:flagellar FliJ protein
VKGFVFRLARVLQLRCGVERQRARELGDAIQQELARRETLERAEERLGRMGEQLSGANENVAPAGTLQNLHLTVEAAADQLDQAAESHAAAEKVVESEQERFGEARRDRKVLEHLRDRRRADWNQESSRQEQRELDEIARRRRVGGDPC